MPTLKRSSNGCWTCKQRRRKCGEEQPFCQACLVKGLVCEGYEKRLRFTGVASRGVLTGATAPLRDQVPPRRPGRQRDHARQEDQRRTQQEQSTSNEVFRSHNDELGRTGEYSSVEKPFHDMTTSLPSESTVLHLELFNEFLSAGHFTLFSTRASDDPLLPIIPQLCKSSRALYSVCVAYQAYLSECPKGVFLECYDAALARFRAELEHPVLQMGDALLIAGLLLCTIGIVQGTVWTIHLRGVERLLQLRGLHSSTALVTFTPCSVQAVEVLGFMDLPFFVLGRQSPYMGIWRDYRTRAVTTPEIADSVESTSGLPRSLIDIFANDASMITEEAMWLWVGCDGEALETHLWEAYRYAGMLDIRRRRRKDSPMMSSHVSPCNTNTSSGHNMSFPSDDVLLTRTFSCLDAVLNCSEEHKETQMHVLNAILYPLFILAVETFQSGRHPSRSRTVETWFREGMQRDQSKGTSLVWQVVEEACDRGRTSRFMDPEDVAIQMEVEVALF